MEGWSINEEEREREIGRKKRKIERERGERITITSHSKFLNT